MLPSELRLPPDLTSIGEILDLDFAWIRTVASTFPLQPYFGDQIFSSMSRIWNIVHFNVSIGGGGAASFLFANAA